MAGCATPGTCCHKDIGRELEEERQAQLKVLTAIKRVLPPKSAEFSLPNQLKVAMPLGRVKIDRANIKFEL